MGDLSKLRNLGVVAHIDAGKTTVSERILFYSGVERRMGEVHEGSATMDWMDEERRRGITIQSAATVVPWRDHRINLIDTPGHVDFTVEVERCMRVLDGAVLVVNGVAGVQAQTETVWRQMQAHHVRALVFVNQLDRPGADYLACVSDLAQRLGAPVVPIAYPVGTGREMRTVVNLLTREALHFDEGTQGRKPRRGPVPSAVEDEVEVLRSELLDILAEEDEHIMGAVLEGREPDLERLLAAVASRTKAGTLVPVLCGAALRNVGVQPLLDAVIDFLPGPAEVPPVKGHAPVEDRTLVCPPEPEAPVCALAFKLQADPSEDLLFARVYAGTIRPGQKLLNPRLGKTERVARVLRLHADMRQALDLAGPGEIVALTGCKFTVTGDTLCGPERPVLLESLHFPEPVLTLTIEPESTAERDKLRVALERLAFEDPSLRVREDEETGQWLVQGMGELHLEIKEHRLREEFGLAVRVGKPRVAYREAPLVPAEGEARVDRHLGDKKVAGFIHLRIRPRSAEETLAGDQAPGTGDQEGGQAPVLPVRGATVGFAEACALPAAIRSALKESVAIELQSGPRFGFPLVGVDVEVLEGEASPDRWGEMAAVQAASIALGKALGGADVHVLEPEMTFEIAAPAGFMSGILGELNARGADVTRVEAEGEIRSVQGRVALARMFGYASILRSLSQGRASFSLAPAGYRALSESELKERGLVWS